MSDRSYRRFYASFSRLCPGGCDPEELKCDLVSQFSLGRTRRLRSSALHQLQLYGVDTTDWSKVDLFCLDKRISGKRFYDLGLDELSALARKMRVINRKSKET